MEMFLFIFSILGINVVELLCTVLVPYATSFIAFEVLNASQLVRQLSSA